MIKSGDTISLSGNEYVKIDPGYYKNVTYEIEKIENGLHHTEKNDVRKCRCNSRKRSQIYQKY